MIGTFLAVLMVALIVLKLLGVIALSWFIILLPLILVVLFYLLIIISMAVIESSTK